MPIARGTCSNARASASSASATSRLPTAAIQPVASSADATMALKRITVLISGRGSNLAALVAASHAADFEGAVTHVVSSRSDASGLAIADTHAIATTIVDHRHCTNRETFDASLSAAIEASEPDLVVLAGFMHLLSDALVIRHAGRMLNIHPSLLPAYPGLRTHRRAI